MPPSRNVVSRSPYQSSRPGDEEEHGEGGGEDRVHLLAGVEAALRAVGVAGEEAAVVAVEEVDLADRLRDARGGCRAATMRRIAPAHEMPVQKWMSLISGRRATAVERDGR